MVYHVSTRRESNPGGRLHALPLDRGPCPGSLCGQDMMFAQEGHAACCPWYGPCWYGKCDLSKAQV
eukprot:4280730-Prymnesium_polylepis.1